MADTYTYSRATLGGISESLNSLFSGMEQGGTQVMRTTNCNLILLVSSRLRLKEIESIVEPLALFHPSRFFLIVLDENAAELQAEVAALCHGISKFENQCAEVIRIVASRKHLASVPGVLRAHSLTGVATELFLGDALIDREVIDLFIPLCEQVYLDSGEFQRSGDVMHYLRQHRGSLIDFQWVHLGVWRDQIGAAFSHPALSGQAQFIRTIEVAGIPSKSSPAEPPFAALLLSGWLVSRLGLSLQDISGGTLKAGRREGGEVTVLVRSSELRPEKDLSGRIAKVRLSGFNAQGKILEVTFERKGDIVETSIQRERVLRFSRPVDDESTSGVIKRYFLIGESITNYSAALGTALEMQRLLSR